MNQIPTSLTHSLMAILLFDEHKAKAIRHGLPLEVWSEDFAIFTMAKRIYNYIDTYQKPPQDHILDIIKEIGFKSDQESLLLSFIDRCRQKYDSNMNFEYVMKSLEKFQRQSFLRDGVERAVGFIEQGKLDEAEDALYEALKRKASNFDPGITLVDGFNSLLDDLEGNDTDNCFSLGIEALDKRLICPTRKELFLYIAPPKSGKSMFMIHCGKRALIQGKRVCHITLEMRDKIVVRRYFQNLWGLTRHKVDSQVKYRIEHGQIYFHRTPERPSMADSLGVISEQLVTGAETLVRNLKIKEFPSGSLTLSGLRAYLEGLEIQHGFLPDEVILDYAPLMKVKNPENKRVELGQTLVEIRGLANERNFALVTANQTNRGGAGAKNVQTTDVSEDFSAIMTADNVLTYSQTQTEREMGLARVLVGASRNEEDKFEVLISQDYASSQWVLDSCQLTNEVGGKLKEAINSFRGDSDG